MSTKKYLEDKERILLDLVDVQSKSEGFGMIQKLQLKSIVSDGIIKIREENVIENIIENVGRTNSYEILTYSSSYIIFKDKSNTADDKYNIRVILLSEDKTPKLSTTVCSNLDEAMIVYLTTKYQENDSARYIMKMLNMQID